MMNHQSLAVSGTQKRDGELDNFLDELRRICGQATIDLALRVGLLVVETFYGGDVGRWRKRKQHDPSLRRLAARGDLPVSVAQLYRCVAIYEISSDIPAFSTWKYLSVSHVRAVLGLPREAQRRLLAEAEHERWTVLRMEAEARAMRNAGRSKRGRPPRRELERKLARLQSWLESFPCLLDNDVFQPTDATDIAALQARIRLVRNRLRDLHHLLKQPKGANENARDSCER